VVKGTVIITGVFGQDGQYLAKKLLENNYRVIGLTTSSQNRLKLFKIPLDNFELIKLHDYSDSFILDLLRNFQPTHVVNFAAQSSVRKSWENEEYTWKINYSLSQNLLRAIVTFNSISKIKIHFTQSGSSEMFGYPSSLPLTENTSMNPISPYAKSKHAAFKECQNQRISSNTKIANLILFNHESFLRDSEFLSSQIIEQAKKVSLGNGNIELLFGTVRRDWGHVQDFMDAVHLIIQESVNEDLIISTGQHNSVKDFASCALRLLGVKDFNQRIQVKHEISPPEIPPIIFGDSTKINELLNWKPKFTFESMIAEILAH
jgi:GDPmannose 4,6-dehydratase